MVEVVVRRGLDPGVPVRLRDVFVPDGSTRWRGEPRWVSGFPDRFEEMTEGGCIGDEGDDAEGSPPEGIGKG